MPSDPTPLDRLTDLSEFLPYHFKDGGRLMVPFQPAAAIVTDLRAEVSRLTEAIEAFMAVDAVVTAASRSNDLDRIADALGLWPAAVRALAAALEPPSPSEPTYPLIGWRTVLDESQKVDARDTIPADGIDYEPPSEPPSDPEPCGLGLQGICQGERSVTVWDDSPTCQRCMDELRAMAEENDR